MYYGILYCTYQMQKCLDLDFLYFINAHSHGPQLVVNSWWEVLFDPQIGRHYANLTLINWDSVRLLSTRFHSFFTSTISGIYPEWSFHLEGVIERIQLRIRHTLHSVGAGTEGNWNVD
jgi:hypothetical protein